jgi:hypothetical protein
MPVEIFMRQGGWASISKGSVMAEFSIRQTFGICNGIWSDMGTEQTIIKDLKGLWLVLVIPALSFIALLNDARRYLVSVHLTRADF